jgi:merlin
VAEEEALLLSHKACEVEQEISRMRMNARKTEEEKLYLERKTREAEMLTVQLVEESKKRAMEAEKLKNELLNARVAEKEAKEKLLTFLTRSTSLPISTSHIVNSSPSIDSIVMSTNSSNPESPILDIEMNSYDLLADGEMEQLSLEIEKER